MSGEQHLSTRFESVVTRDAADLARQVADRFCTVAAAPVGRKMAVALTGGKTPTGLYETLAEPPFRDRVDWSRLELFFSDERAVPSDHPDSNYRMASETLLAKLPVSAHRMSAETGDAESYERLLYDLIVERHLGIPVLDLVLLGVGTDGHTASLFPRTSATEERTRLVVMNDVPQLGTHRMTFTYPLLNAARRVWVLISGPGKRQIVERCREARPRAGAARQYPVLGVRPDPGELIWWLDRASAGCLPTGPPTTNP